MEKQMFSILNNKDRVCMNDYREEGSSVQGKSRGQRREKIFNSEIRTLIRDEKEIKLRKSVKMHERGADLVGMSWK